MSARDEWPDPGVSPLGGDGQARAFARARQEAQPSGAMVHSSPNGLRYWYVCARCQVRSIRESFIRDEVASWGMRHDRDVHGGKST